VTEASKKDDKQSGRDALIVETPSGKKVNTGRLVMGVGYTYTDGSAVSEEDKAFVDAEVTKRAKK
jgi:hypothetical protein